MQQPIAAHSRASARHTEAGVGRGGQVGPGEGGKGAVHGAVECTARAPRRQVCGARGQGCRLMAVRQQQRERGCGAAVRDG